MALVSLPWVNDKWMSCPPPPCQGGVPAFGVVTLDASADRIVLVGRFQHKDRTTKTIDGAGFLFGTNVKTNGSTLKATLQDVTLTTGPVLREDGTPDQTISIANADAGFASNAWYEAAFDAAATRSLTHGELIALVVQFDSFVAGDTVQLRGLSLIANVQNAQQGTFVANLTGTYAIQGVQPNCVFRCTDGSYGTLENAFVCSAVTMHSYAANTAVADEYAIGIQYPCPVKLDGLWLQVAFATAADTTELLLYSGTTALATVTIDHNTVASAGARPLETPFLEQALTANTLYRLAVRPTANNAINAHSFDVAFVNHLQCHPGGVNAHLWTRLDQGAWGGEVTTRRLFGGVRLSAFDDGVSSGGGVPLLGRGLVQ